MNVMKIKEKMLEIKASKLYINSQRKLGFQAQQHGE